VRSVLEPASLPAAVLLIYEFSACADCVCRSASFSTTRVPLGDLYGVRGSIGLRAAQQSKHPIIAGVRRAG